MKAFNKIADVLDAVAKWVATISVGIMWVVTCYAVIMRYFFRDPIIWGDELPRFMLVWMTFYGGAGGLRRRSLANMSMVVDLFPSKPKKWIGVVVSCLNVFLLAFFTYFAMKLTMQPAIAMQMSPAMGLPMRVVYSCMPIGMFLMIVQQIVLIIEDIRGKDGEVEQV